MRNAYRELVPIRDQLAIADHRMRTCEKRVMTAALRLGREGRDLSRLAQWSAQAIHSLQHAVDDLDIARRDRAMVRARARRRGAL